VPAVTAGAGAADAVGPAVERGVLIATVLASGMVFIDSTVVNVALPALQRGFGADLAGLQWVVESYFLALVALLLVGGALGDRYGRRRVFVAGTVVFAAASLACGLAQSVAQLVAARALQGVGGALLVPGSLAIITATFDDARRGRAIGVWSAWSALTVSAAPLLGGWLIDVAGWRTVFLINLPLAAAVVAISARFVPESRDADADGPVDWPGAALATLGLGALVFGLIEGPRLGVGSPLVAGGLAVGVAGLAGFLAREARAAHPMMPLDLFRHRAFAATNALTLLLYGGFGGALFFLPLHLMSVRGYTALEAGAATLPLAVLIAALSRRTGALVDRWGARLPLSLGPAIVAAGLALIALPGLEGGYWTSYFPGVAVLGLGMGLTVAPLTTAVMNAAPRTRAGVASGINNALSRVAFLIAIAGLGVVATAVFAGSLPDDVRAALGPAVLRLGAAEPPASAVGEARAAMAASIDAAALAAFRVALLTGAALALAAALVGRLGLGPPGTNRAGR